VGGGQRVGGGVVRRWGAIFVVDYLSAFIINKIIVLVDGQQIWFLHRLDSSLRLPLLVHQRVLRVWDLRTVSGIPGLAAGLLAKPVSTQRLSHGKLRRAGAQLPRGHRQHHGSLQGSPLSGRRGQSRIGGNWFLNTGKRVYVIEYTIIYS